MSLVDFGIGLAAIQDVMRLGVVFVFAWAAWLDIQTRQVPNWMWGPVVLGGGVLFLWEGLSAWGTTEWVFFAVSAILSICSVSLAAYGLWVVGAFGGADAKALIVLAIVFPTYPSYYIGAVEYPIVGQSLGVFVLAVLVNAVVLVLFVPLVLGAVNAVRGDWGWAMCMGRVHPVVDVQDLPGRLLETEGGLTRSGLDLQTLRLYLQWRDVTLEDLRAAPHVFRDPVSMAVKEDTVYEETQQSDSYNPSASAVSGSPVKPHRTVCGTEPMPLPCSSVGEDRDVDWWGGQQFLAETNSVTGTTASEITTGLDVLVTQDSVWVSPGLPFIVPVFVGLVLALVYGNVMIGVFRLVGLA